MIMRLMAACALACLIATPALAQTGDSDAKKTAAQVSKAFADAYNAGKPADIAAMFAQGGVYLTPGGTMLTDHQEMTAALAGRQKAGWTDETINVIEAHPEGDDVWAVVDYTIKGTGASSGKQIGGYAAQILTREASTWRFKLLAGTLKPVQDVTGMAPARTQ